METNETKESFVEKGEQFAEKADTAMEAGKEDEAKKLDKQAVLAFESALKMDNNNGRILLLIGAQHFNSGNPEKALLFYDRAIPNLQESK